MPISSVDTELSTRRRFLAAAGTVACASAIGGCSTFTTLLGTPTALKDISITGDTLTVTLSAETDATTLTVIQPNGQPLWRTQLSAGQTRVTVPLLYPKNGVKIPIPPETYTVVVGKDEEELDSQEVTLTQSMTLDNVGVYETSLQNDFGPDVTATTDITATITNTGNHSLRITYLGLTSGVPSPSQFPAREGTFDGAFKRQKQLPPTRQGLVLPDRTATFHTVTKPLQFYEDPNDPAPKQWQGESGHCQGDTHEATLVIAGTNTLRKQRTIAITYDGKSLSTQAIDADWACTNISLGKTSNQTAKT